MLDKKNFYINGKWTSPIEPRNYKVINPSNEEPCAEISLGGKKDVDNAVSAAIKIPVIHAKFATLSLYKTGPKSMRI